jgi:mannose-1-phosphate guanylyltransferase
MAISRAAGKSGRACSVRRASSRKPDLATAHAYLESGDYLWNAGIFLMRAETYLDALEAHAPDILSAARSAIVAQREEGNRVWPDARGLSRGRRHARSITR